MRDCKWSQVKAIKMRSALFFFCFLCVVADSFVRQLEAVALYHTRTKPPESVSIATDVAGLGEVQVSLERDNLQGVLSGLSVSYSELATVELGREAVGCIPNPSIEAPLFRYHELEGHATVPGDWQSSVWMHFSVNEQEDGSLEGAERDAIALPLYPYVEFEFVGFKVSRMKIVKSPGEVKALEAFDEACPSGLIDWVKGAGSVVRQHEEPAMREPMFKPYESLSTVIDVGGPLGKVRVDLERDDVQNVLSGLSVSYGDLGRVELGREAVGCIPNPSIEAPQFLYTELGDRSIVPDQWHSSVLIYFAASGLSGENAAVLPLYPYVEFEFIGLKVGRVSVRKSSGEFKILNDFNGACPSGLIDWAGSTESVH